MSTIEKEVVSTFPLSAEILEQYAGKWIAARDGAIIASADDFDALVAQDDVRPTDVLFRVPEAGTYFL